MIGPCAERLYAVEPAGVGDQGSVARKLAQPHLAVDGDPQLGGLARLAQQGDLVDGQGLAALALGVHRVHDQGVDHGALGRVDPVEEGVLAVLVHQEAHRAAVHAVDRPAALQVLVQGLEHEAVAAESDDDLGLVRAGLAIARDQGLLGLLRFRAVAGGEGQPGDEGFRLEHGAAKVRETGRPSTGVHGLAKGGARNMGLERAKGAAGASSALLTAARKAGVELADHGEDGGKGAAVDADSRAGQAQKLRRLGIDGPTNMARLEAAEGGKGREEEAEAAFLQGAKQVAGTELAGRRQLFDHPAFHVLAGPGVLAAG
jgi:hypothetical protein